MIKIIHLKRNNGDTAVIATDGIYESDRINNEVKKALGWELGEFEIEQAHSKPVAVIEKTYCKDKVRAEILPEDIL